MNNTNNTNKTNENERSRVINNIKDYVLSMNQLIIDCYIHKDHFGTLYDIVTDTNTINLRVWKGGRNQLFHELTLFDCAEQHILMSARLTCESDIVEMLMNYYTNQK